MSGEAVTFWIIAPITVLGGIGLVVSRKAVHSALWLAVTMIGLARRTVGLWKRFAFRGRTFRPDPDRGAAWNRGAYLVHGPGHCDECHTPRNALMILDDSRALEGGPHPRGEGHVPGLRDLLGRGRYSDAADLALALQFGETLGYDKLSSGGMAEVQMSLARLPETDRQAISEYLLSLR